MFVDTDLFRHDVERTSRELGWARKDGLVRLLRKSYTENVDWKEYPAPKDGKSGRPACSYKMTDHCLQTIIVRDRTRNVTQNNTSINAGGTRLEYVRRILPAGIESISFLMKALGGSFHLSPEYRVGKYRVDLYIHKHNVVIECDENNHKNYSQKAETERTAGIDEALNGPRWVRFNPDSPNFDIACVVQDIMALLL